MLGERDRLVWRGGLGFDRAHRISGRVRGSLGFVCFCGGTGCEWGRALLGFVPWPTAIACTLTCSWVEWIIGWWSKRPKNRVSYFFPHFICGKKVWLSVDLNGMFFSLRYGHIRFSYYLSFLAYFFFSRSDFYRCFE